MAAPLVSATTSDLEHLLPFSCCSQEVEVGREGMLGRAGFGALVLCGTGVGTGPGPGSCCATGQHALACLSRRSLPVLQPTWAATPPLLDRDLPSVVPTNPRPHIPDTCSRPVSNRPLPLAPPQFHHSGLQPHTPPSPAPVPRRDNLRFTHSLNIYGAATVSQAGCWGSNSDRNTALAIRESLCDGGDRHLTGQRSQERRLRGG